MGITGTMVRILVRDSRQGYFGFLGSRRSLRVLKEGLGIEGDRERLLNEQFVRYTPHDDIRPLQGFGYRAVGPRRGDCVERDPSVPTVGSGARSEVGPFLSVFLLERSADEEITDIVPLNPTVVVERDIRHDQGVFDTGNGIFRADDLGAIYITGVSIRRDFGIIGSAFVEIRREIVACPDTCAKRRDLITGLGEQCQENAPVHTVIREFGQFPSQGVIVPVDINRCRHSPNGCRVAGECSQRK